MNVIPGDHFCKAPRSTHVIASQRHGDAPDPCSVPRTQLSAFENDSSESLVGSSYSPDCNVSRAPCNITSGEYIDMYESILKNNELENEVSSDMSYFWYSDKGEKNLVK